MDCCYDYYCVACGCCMVFLCMLQRRNSKSDNESETTQDTDINLDVKKTKIDIEGLCTMISLLRL